MVSYLDCVQEVETVTDLPATLNQKFLTLIEKLATLSFLALGQGHSFVGVAAKSGR
jgi:hypothetical protein